MLFTMGPGFRDWHIITSQMQHFGRHNCRDLEARLDSSPQAWIKGGMTAALRWLLRPFLQIPCKKASRGSRGGFLGCFATAARIVVGGSW